MTVSKNDFSGIWHSSYTYTSSRREGVFTSEYDVNIYRRGDHLIIESLPNEEKSYLIMRLSLNLPDGRIATGTFEEYTSPTGPYEGSICPGAVQLILSEDGNTWQGKYIAYSRSMAVFANEWTITRKQ